MNFTKARFHIDSGPESLFTRVKFQMKDVHEIKIHGAHFLLRCKQRSIPDEVLYKIQHFSVFEWTLKTCEVRVDTGKFVNSTWESEFDGNRYWLTVGFGNAAETIIRKDSFGKKGIVSSGELYEYVDQVNTLLMSQEEDWNTTNIKSGP